MSKRFILPYLPVIILGACNYIFFSTGKRLIKKKKVKLSKDNVQDALCP